MPASKEGHQSFTTLSTEPIDLLHFVTEQCLLAYEQEDNIDPLLLSERIMDRPEFPMHATVHHYLVPAVLLTFARKAQGHGREVLERDLAAAKTRAENMPGGACGFLGACGASVGVGIFLSLMTDTTPLSPKTWGLVNEGTALALLSIAKTGGPRCCKRCTWLSIQAAREKIESIFKLTVPNSVSFVCNFHHRNPQCIGRRCPFYANHEGSVSTRENQQDVRS